MIISIVAEEELNKVQHQLLAKLSEVQKQRELLEWINISKHKALYKNLLHKTDKKQSCFD